MDIENLKDKNVILATHAHLVDGEFNLRSGPTLPLLNYFSKKINYFFLIGQPPPYVKDSLSPFLFIYKNGVLKEKFYFNNFIFNIPVRLRMNKTSLRLKIRDFVSVLYFSKIIRRFVKDEPICIYFGVESVNAVAGSWVRNYLKIENVVYYIFDWSIKWFLNPIFNSIYLFFDKFACYHSNYIWNISNSIANARIQNLKFSERRMGRQITVPYGMPFRENLVNDEIAENPNTIVYSGYISEENGAMLLPDIAREIAKSSGDFKLVIVGDGDCFEEMQQKINEYGLNNVIIAGHFNNQEEVDKLLVKSHVAVAPYKPVPFSKKLYSDVIKIRNYIACGLPVITTSAVPLSEEINKENLGFVVDFDAKNIAEHCLTLLKDKILFKSIRLKVIDKARKHSWENIYSNTLEKMSK